MAGVQGMSAAAHSKSVAGDPAADGGERGGGGDT
jgi:hypothetical protein